ncbi:MAG TPA: Gfo/Idh/MocA family oxidoreductase [Aggregatilineales bacterium]|nr:Gfo/Idh/MocA family oxidoreductase [Anaerolineales bacterium]HRE47557.1 Gfo/Idh/MocA family oxidoreductase [Aggregatilineales bacterium]
MTQTAAIIGTGFMGRVHTEALRRVGVTVLGILGSSPEKSRQAAESFAIPHAYPHVDALAADPSVQVVHVTTPNKDHFSQCERLLKAGKHVICEKPLAMNAAESAQLVALAAAHPTLVACVNYNLRYYPMIQHCRAMVRAGEIGTILAVRGAYVQDWLLYPTDWNWRVEAAAGGKLRAVGDIGTHWLDMISFITGLTVESLCADMATVHPTRRKPRHTAETFQSAGAQTTDDTRVDTEDWASVLLRYAGGVRGAMSTGQITAGRKNSLSFEISGSKGALAWHHENPNELWIGRRDTPNEVIIKDPNLMRPEARDYANYPGGHAEGYSETFKELYRAVYRYIAQGDFAAPRPFPTFADGHQQMCLCDAILASHEGHGWVTVG